MYFSSIPFVFNEFSKLKIRSDFIHRFPADVDPLKCPNYPLCDTPELPALDVEIPELPKHTQPHVPADVDPLLCPNYPLCDTPELPTAAPIVEA